MSCSTGEFGGVSSCTLNMIISPPPWHTIHHSKFLRMSALSFSNHLEVRVRHSSFLEHSILIEALYDPEAKVCIRRQPLALSGTNELQLDADGGSASDTGYLQDLQKKRLSASLSSTSSFFLA